MGGRRGYELGAAGCAAAVAALLVIAGAAPAARAAALRCAVDDECASGTKCRQGVCRTTCSGDSDCNAAASEACVVGQCMPVFNVTYPLDYGLADGNNQPGCSGDADCQPTIACMGGRCQLPEACKAEGVEARDEFCPRFGSYKCNAATNHCEGPACDPALAGADCAAAYPIAGLRCIGGRCTSRCTTAADCCSGAGVRCPAGRAQGTCFQVDTTAPGVCAATVATGRLIAYQLARTDPRPPVRNIVLVSEGFRLQGADRTELDHFVNNALKHIQWQTTHADMLAALLSPDLFNIFILELPDRFSGLDQPTLFGSFAINRDDTTAEYPGSDAAVGFMTHEALLAFEQAAMPALTPAPSEADRFTVFHVVLFNGDTSKRAHSNLGDMIFQLVGNDDGPDFDTGYFLVYNVLQHELGHSLAQVDDEYDNDIDTGTPPACSINTVARTTVTVPPCSTCDTSTFHPELSSWTEFVNTMTFPTTDSSSTTVGLYAGAEERFPKESMRSQRDCEMRGGGREEYCTACREAFMHNLIGDQKSQSFRFLDMPEAMLAPVEAGIGPNVAVAVDGNRHHAYFTREVNGDVAFSDVDTNALVRSSVTDVKIQGALGGAGIPRTITPVDRFVLLEGIHPTDPTKSKILVYDGDTKSMATPVSLPGLLGTPARVPTANPSGGFIVYRLDPDTAENQLAFVDVGASGPGAPTFSAPTTRAGGIPRLEQVPVAASTAGLMFFASTKTIPADTFCDFDHCDIWVLDPATRQFVDPILRVNTPGVSEAGILAMTIGQHVTGIPAEIPGELLIVVTDNLVLVWQTAQVKAGNTVPAAQFAHNLGGTSLITGVAFVPQTEEIVLTNRAGVVAVYGVRGEGAPGGDRITIPGLTSDMEIRDLAVGQDGGAYLVAGGFSGPRAGLIASLDLTGNRLGSNRVIFTQSVSAIGLARPAIAIDERHSVVYTNAVVESGDNTGIDNSHRFRVPLVRGLSERRFNPAGCP